MQTNREPEPPLAFAVTTSARPSPRELANAHCLADETGCRYVPRVHRSLAGMAADESTHGADRRRARQFFNLWVAGRCLRYHPNMAKLRILALEQGKHDILVDALQLKLGDCVLDCTCGLGADAIVASCKVGATGRVRSLEASPLLALLVERMAWPAM